ncbi:class F sortase [Yinghuangia sp. ASG 101]|uniref:class F sortase n=1 Tax=Yinghuangia sp. ASG 101 TaxID=2896848 RepID=UPI001E4BB5BF|nr:class F sortase [Yinghuangia sp. ASG 101]UGQ10791.1 class F sortase [Yinghuangia sp. ASG 101]
MSAPRAEAPQRPGRLKLLTFAAGAVILGVCVIGNDLGGTPGPPQPPVAQAAPTAGSAAAPDTGGTPSPDGSAAGPSPTAKTLKSSPPYRVHIPRIKVNAPVVGLGLDASGVLEVPPPTNSNLVGWYKGGPAPGARGASILVGHVDTKSGPAVFWNLGVLRPGDEIAVDRADGRTATFRIDSVEVFEKTAFPNDRVYGETSDAQLRLITCGGVYDKQNKDYTSNVVAFAHLVSST